VPGGRWLGFADPWGNELGLWEIDPATVTPEDLDASPDGQG
jgi:hypothetical protein